MTEQEALAEAKKVEQNVLTACGRVHLTSLLKAKKDDGTFPAQAAQAALNEGVKKLKAFVNSNNLADHINGLTPVRMDLGVAADTTSFTLPGCVLDGDALSADDSRIVSAARGFDNINPPLFELSKALAPFGDKTTGTIDGEVDQPPDMELP